MTDYLGPLTLAASGTYTLLGWSASKSEGGVTAAVEVRVTAASADALTVAVEALAAQLQIGNSYVHTVPGVTYPVVYRIASASPLSYDEYGGVLAFWMDCSFGLILAAQPAGALTTLYSAQHVDTPASVALSALLGTHPTSLDVTIDDDNGTDMHSVWCALAPTALSDAKWYVLASALTWTTMSSGTGATYWGNSNRYTTSATYQTAPLDTSQYPAGKYRLLARVRQEAGTGYVKDSQNDTAVAITRTTPHLLVVGDLDLPVADTASGVAANLTISVKSDGTNDCMLNALVLLPLDYGYFSWHHATDTTEIDQLDVGPTGIFMDGSCDLTHFSGGILTPRVLAAHVGTLVATASPTGSDWPSNWTRTNGTDVTADTSRFKVVCAAASSKYAIYAATNATTPLIVPGAWYELSFTRDVDSYSAGAATASIVWQDVDGNAVRTDLLSTTAANDAAPLAVTVYAKAPAHAARAQLKLGGTSATLTVFFSAVVLRRCPLRLILVAEDAAGALTSYLHPVHLTLKYSARYEVSR
jgi:hypothetical protein